MDKDCLTYNLSEDEQLIARYVAALRQHMNRTSGVKDQAVKPGESYQADLNGYGAELAFASISNVCPDLSLHCRKGGYDLLYKENRIDVKTTTYKNGTLLSNKVNPDVDLYVLLIGQLPTFTFVGWVWSEELIQEVNLKDFGHGKKKEAYALKQDQLQSPKTFSRRKNETSYLSYM